MPAHHHLSCNHYWKKKNVMGINNLHRDSKTVYFKVDVFYNLCVCGLKSSNASHPPYSVITNSAGHISV